MKSESSEKRDFFQTRQESSRSLELTERDLTLLKDLFESRLLSLHQVTEIHFEGRYPSAKRRVAKLRAGRFINGKRIRIGRGEQLFIFLARRGFEQTQESLRQHYSETSFRKLERRIAVAQRTIEHEHQVVEVKASFLRAARGLPLSIRSFCTWPKLIEFPATRPVETGDYNFGTKILTKESFVQPDGFFRVIHEDGSDHHFYLEVDRSTERRRTLLSKAIGYRNWLNRGGHAKRFGFDDPKQTPFRVLMIFQTEERRNNFFDTVLRHPQPIKGLVWATTFEKLKDDPFGSHWLNPLEYHRAVDGHPDFDPLLTEEPVIYIRRPEREQLVSENANYLSLISSKIDSK